MTTNDSSSEQISSIYIDIDGKKYCLKLSYSNNVAELRTILTNRYHISSNTHFLNAEEYALHPEDEQSFTIDELLNKDNIIKLITNKNQSILERKKKIDTNYSQSTRTSLHEIKLPDSISIHRENKIILATDLEFNMWEKIFRICNLLCGIRMDGETPKRAFRPVLKFKESINDIFPLFQVTDDSNIRIYMKDKEIQSSFLSSQFFDGGIDFSSPFFGIGINAEYSKSKTKMNIKKKTYLTYCYNFPRVTLEIDLSYLELTSQFIEDIDYVINIIQPDEQIIKLEEILSKYGHVYSRLVVLGAHLYHTEIHDNQEKAEEAKRRINTEISLAVSVIQPAKIHTGVEFKQQSQNKYSEQTSLLTFEAVGGDTRLNHDPTLWTSTIADPSSWRIIEQDNYQSILTLLDKQRQEKIQKIFNYSSFNKIFIPQQLLIPYLNINQKWIQNGIIQAGGHGFGNQLNQLSSPWGMYIDDDQTIYVADYGNDRIMEWKNGVTSGKIIAGGNGRGNKNNQLNNPTNVIIDKRNDCLIICDKGNRRVVRWPRQNGQSGETIISNINCGDLIMDNDGYLYVSDLNKHEVRRWKIGETEGTIVAGGNGKGNCLNQLNCPYYIFIDEDQSVYISDWNNHRVMKWIKDAKAGIIVAGCQCKGNGLKQLSYPNGIIVDQLGSIYVADRDNNRVVRWLKGAHEGTIIIGENRFEKQLNQISYPEDLLFDRQNNLYVVDRGNNPIQKFDINLN